MAGDSDDAGEQKRFWQILGSARGFTVKPLQKPQNQMKRRGLEKSVSELEVGSNSSSERAISCVRKIKFFGLDHKNIFDKEEEGQKLQVGPCGGLISGTIKPFELSLRNSESPDFSEL